MYPFFRLALQMRRARRDGPLPWNGVHRSVLRCWPSDLDPWRELNNGRTLTLYDLGRVPLGARLGFDDLWRDRRWTITVAGASVRYRRRIRLFDRLVVLSRIIGWDARFVYVEQSLWRGGECANQVLIRWAVTGPEGLVPIADVVAALGWPAMSPALPGWVSAWIAAEATRPWPPEVGP